MTDEMNEINGIERSLKIQKIEAILGDLKTGLVFFQNQIDSIQKHLEELNSLSIQDEITKPEADPKQIPLFAEVTKKAPTVRRVDSEEEKPETTVKYNIQVVGLGTTNMDF
jgi:hypothetical protein